MKQFIIALSSIFLCLPFAIFAQQSHRADTVGMKVSHEHKITQTVVIVEQFVDSIMSLDSAGHPNKVAVYTNDTLSRIDTTVKSDTNYLLIKPVVYWEKLNTAFMAGVSQTARVNWAAGGGNTYSVFFSNKSYAYYKRDFSVWETKFEWDYGFQQQEGTPWFKNLDRIEITSEYGFRASDIWYYNAFVNFKSQLTKGYGSATDAKENYISRFFSPAYSTFSIGMKYTNIPKTVNLFLSPVAYKLTYVMDTALSRRYSIPECEHWLTQFGPMAELNNKHTIAKGVLLESRLNLLADILSMKEPFVTVNWYLTLSSAITKRITLKLSTNLIYDPAVKFVEPGPNETTKEVRKVQFQEILMLNFTYKLGY